MEKQKQNSARGLVRVARELADTVGVPLQTHRMHKVPALLVINAILNRQRGIRMEQRGASSNDVVIRMGGAR
jgi:hypothetical protein